MEETTSKKGAISLYRYWRFFLPLALILAIMVKFPLRIYLQEVYDDSFIFGMICLFCIVTTIWVYRRFGKRGYRLMAVTLLCSMLSGWQVFDLVILRYGSPFIIFGYYTSPDYDGFADYGLRFPDDDILCHILRERYFGNYLIAITLDIERDASWWQCGG